MGSAEQAWQQETQSRCEGQDLTPDPAFGEKPRDEPQRLFGRCGAGMKPRGRIKGKGKNWLHDHMSSYLQSVGTITTTRSAAIVKQLEADGWTLRSVHGSHHVFNHPVKPGHISVPHPKKDLGVGLTHKLLKQAGLK